MPKKIRKGEIIRAKWLNEIVAELVRLGKISVVPPLQLFSSKEGIVLSLSNIDRGFWAKITGSEQITGQNRWKYAWQQVIQTEEGYEGWEEYEKGYGDYGDLADSSEQKAYPAYNLLEIDGDATEAVPDGTIVRMWRSFYEGDITYWFIYPSGAKLPPTPTEDDKGKVVSVSNDLTLVYTTVSGGNTGTSLYFEGWIRVAPNASAATITLDNNDWRGRLIWYSCKWFSQTTETSVKTLDYGTGNVARVGCGVNYSNNRTICSEALQNGATLDVYISGSNGHLIAELSSNGDADEYQMLLWIQAATQRSEATHEFT